MPTPMLPDRVDDSASAWDRALYAFLAEKERRSGSMRTVQSYSRMLTHFFGSLSKTPDRIASPEALAWAHGVGLSGRKPSAVTVGARIACLSSFYRFLIRMGAIASNPCDALERPRTGQSQARGYGGDDVRTRSHPRHHSRPARPGHDPHGGDHRQAWRRGGEPESR
jgi:site-specific recombinase XerD